MDRGFKRVIAEHRAELTKLESQVRDFSEIIDETNIASIEWSFVKSREEDARAAVSAALEKIHALGKIPCRN